MPKQYRYYYMVQGHGSFPVDMLRYDAAYPTGRGDMNAIARSYTDIRYMEQAKLELTSLRPPTEDRWASFGWRVLEMRREG